MLYLLSHSSPDLPCADDVPRDPAARRTWFPGALRSSGAACREFHLHPPCLWSNLPAQINNDTIRTGSFTVASTRCCFAQGHKGSHIPLAVDFILSSSDFRPACPKWLSLIAELRWHLHRRRIRLLQFIRVRRCLRCLVCR
jgi:hypothetical protein